MMKYALAAIAASGVAAASHGAGQIVISEYMYNSDLGGGEFVELTNIGDMPIDVTGWTLLDNTSDPDPEDYFDLGSFGSIAPGESVVITETDATTFRTQWSLSGSVKVLGDLGAVTGKNYGRNDSIRVFDASLTLVDTLDYGDQDFPGALRTVDFSAWAPYSEKGDNNIFGWVESTLGDLQGSWTSSYGAIGNPGVHVVPTPGAAALAGLALAAGARRRR